MSNIQQLNLPGNPPSLSSRPASVSSAGFTNKAAADRPLAQTSADPFLDDDDDILFLSQTKPNPNTFQQAKLVKPKVKKVYC